MDSPPVGSAAESPASKTATRRADVAHAARGGVVQFLGVVAQGLMPLYYAVVGRLYGQTALGFYSGSLAITEILTRLGLCGADKGMLRFIAAHRAADEDDLERRALGTGLRLSLATTLVIALALVVGSSHLARWMGRPSLAFTLPFMAPAVVAAPFMLIIVAATLGRKVTRMSLYLRGFVEPGFLLVAALVAHLGGAGIRGLAAAHGLAYLAIAGAAIVAAAAIFGGRQLVAALRAPRHPTFVRFALPVALSEGVNSLFQRTDMLLLPLFARPEEVAAYFAAEFLGRVSANVRYAFDGIAAPMLAEALALHDKERLRYNLRLLTRWVTTLALPLATVMVSLRENFLLLYGPGFVMASNVVVIHTVGHLLTGTLGLCGHVVMMSGRSRLVLLNQIGATIVNFALWFVFVPRFGIAGAALSVLVSLVGLVAAMLIEVWVLEGVHPFHLALIKPLMAAAPTLAVQLFLVRLLPGAPGALLALLAGVVTYFVALMALRPPREEREALASAGAKIKRAFSRADRR